MALLLPDLSGSAYDGLAPHYDAFTAGYEYGRWLDALEALAIEHGLAGKRLLDIGCGTGKSFIPMLGRGYEVVACDLSPSMVERAREKARDVEVVVADMRQLPRLGAFDLITCLDDAVNYLTSPGELRAAMRGFARNLGPGGVALFDANTLTTYGTAFASDSALDRDGAFICWRGEADPDPEPGMLASAWIEVFEAADDGSWRRSRTRHLQRHHPREEVAAAVAGAGLELVAVRGQSPGARLDAEPDESLHSKVVYVARRPVGREDNEGVIPLLIKP
jgi:SAM-dependent methyltransferase